jgi:peptidoglycan/LPS O-acetylase OafA/YrhL
MLRNKALDFLRFIGVLLTLFAHLQLPNKSNELSFFILTQLKLIGQLGVMLFFVLSGYLVSGLIFKEVEKYGTFSVKRFLIRRGFKIYPSYYFAILLGIFISLFANNKYYLDQIFYESVFLCNYFKIKNYWLWSISVEEHFYLILPFLLLILYKLKKLNLKYIAIIYLIFMLISGGSYVYNIYHYTFTSYQSHLHFHLLFWGVLLFYVNTYERERLTLFYKFKGWFFVISSFSLVYFMLQSHGLSPASRVAFNLLKPIFLGFILLYFLDTPSFQNNFFMKVFAFIGLYSYPIYLYHGYVNQLTKRMIHSDLTYCIYFAAYFIGSFLLGILLSKIIEYPFIRIRDKYFPSRSK